MPNRFCVVMLSVILMPMLSYAGDKMGRDKLLSELNNLESSGEWRLVYKDGSNNIIRATLPFFSTTSIIMQGKSFSGSGDINNLKTVSSIYTSTDGNTIAFCVENWGVEDEGIVSTIYLIENGTLSKKIELPGEEGWQPNAILGFPSTNEILLLYFKDGSVTRKVFLLNISTKKIKLILETSGLQSIGYKSLSSDGKNLLYRDENGYLSILNIRSDGKKELISTSAGLNPTWSPSDNSIVFRELDDNLYIIDSEGLNKRILFSQKRERGYLVHDVESWSPDGRYVLFSLEPGSEQFSGGIIPKRYPKHLVMNVETKENLEIEEK